MTDTFGTPCIVNLPSPGCPADAVCVTIGTSDGRSRHIVVPTGDVSTGILRVYRYGGPGCRPRPPGATPKLPDGSELVNLYRAALDTNPVSAMIEDWCVYLRPDQIVPFSETRP